MKKLRQNSLTSLPNGRWLAYATAGVASALGTATSAEAEIHYSGVLDIKFKHPREPGGDVEAHKLPLSGGVFLGFVRETGGSYYVEGAAGVAGAAISNALRGGFFMSRLESGVNVSSGKFYDVGELGELFFIYNSGNFAPPGEGFIGFRFDNGSGMQYGWARLEMGKYPRHNFEVVDYAWADPGESITTGQSSSAGKRADTVPNSGSLGLLALGGAGLMAWRKRRRSTVAATPIL